MLISLMMSFVNASVSVRESPLDIYRFLYGLKKKKKKSPRIKCQPDRLCERKNKHELVPDRILNLNSPRK